MSAILVRMDFRRGFPEFHGKDIPSEKLIEWIMTKFYAHSMVKDLRFRYILKSKEHITRAQIEAVKNAYRQNRNSRFTA